MGTVSTSTKLDVPVPPGVTLPLWRSGTATGVGSLPGEDPLEARHGGGIGLATAQEERALGPIAGPG